MNKAHVLTVILVVMSASSSFVDDEQYSIQVVPPGTRAKAGGLFILLGPEGRFREPRHRNVLLDDRRLAELIRAESASEAENCRVIQIYFVDEEQTDILTVVRAVKRMLEQTKKDKVIIYLNVKGGP